MQHDGTSLKIWEGWRGRSKRRTVRVSLGQYEGTDYIDVRGFVVDERGRMVATPKGVTIPLKIAREFARGFEKAIARAAALGLLDDPKSATNRTPRADTIKAGRI